MSTIPASQLINVLPGVLQAGGSALDLSALFLTSSTRIPIGTVAQFPSAAAVSTFFGPSHELDLATIYFSGFIGESDAPGNLLMAQYNSAAVAAYLRGGNLSALTLAQLQSISGTLTVIMDGYSRAAGTVNLSGATSQSNAASIIQTALNAAATSIATFTAAISGNTLTVSGSVTGTPLAIGQTISGAGVTAAQIVALGSGTGGAGTYTLGGATQTVASESMSASPTPLTVAYDSVSGAFVLTSGVNGVASLAAFATGSISGSLLLTSVAGAVISQGAAAAVPGAFMDAIVAQTQNWATFMTTFNPDTSNQNSVKLAFANWNNGKNNRYAYICADPDSSPTTVVPASSSLGFLLDQANISGTYLIFEPGQKKAAFNCGIAASIDFGATAGRTTFAYRSQDGLLPDVTDATIANNLLLNGYNFYGAYATANQQFEFMQNGQISGPFNWMDSYINQIQLNNSFQLSLMILMTTVKSIPYNAAGNAMIEETLNDDITEAINFGTIRVGVTPSATEAIAANAAAGVKIDNVLATQGWYLQVLTPSASVRQARGSPVCNFWYMDGQSIQKITLASINVQ